MRPAARDDAEAFLELGSGPCPGGEPWTSRPKTARSSASRCNDNNSASWPRRPPLRRETPQGAAFSASIAVDASLLAALTGAAADSIWFKP
jgi:hypothetical protein